MIQPLPTQMYRSRCGTRRSYVNGNAQRHDCHITRSAQRGTRVSDTEVKPDAVHVLLHSEPIPDMSKLRLYDILLACKDTNKDDNVERRYLQTIDLIFAADTHQLLPRPSETTTKAAIVDGNDLDLEKFQGLGTIKH